MEPPKLGGDVDAELLAILACPLDKQPVTRQGNYLVCEECQRHYPIREGIPVMLIDEALTPEQAAAAPWLSRLFGLRLDRLRPLRAAPRSRVEHDRAGSPRRSDTPACAWSPRPRPT